MFEGIDLSKINLNDMMGQVQEMAEKAKEEGKNKVCFIDNLNKL